MQRSSNCNDDYTKRVTSIHQGKYDDPNGTCSITTPYMFSCQKKDFEAPDEATQASLRKSAEVMLSEKGCDPSAAMRMKEFNSSVVGALVSDISPEKMAVSHRASSCFTPGHDPSYITHKVRGVCTNQYDYTDEKGRSLRDTTRKVDVELFVCGDFMDDVEDDVKMFEDVRKVAQHVSGENGLFVKKASDFSCKFSVLPAF